MLAGKEGGDLLAGVDGGVRRLGAWKSGSAGGGDAGARWRINQAAGDRECDEHGKGNPVFLTTFRIYVHPYSKFFFFWFTLATFIQNIIVVSSVSILP
jgi:hypothetical protein